MWHALVIELCLYANIAVTATGSVRDQLGFDYGSNFFKLLRQYVQHALPQPATCSRRRYGVQTLLETM
jgi:hypothetical protein